MSLHLAISHEMYGDAFSVKFVGNAGPLSIERCYFRVRFEGHVAVFNHIGLHMDVTGHHSLAVA